MQLEYLDRSNQYNMAIALASDAANVAQYGMRRKDPDTAHCVCTPAVAAIAAQLWLQRTLYVRTQYRFKLGWMFALLEPGDLLYPRRRPRPCRLPGPHHPDRRGREGRHARADVRDLLVGVAHTPLYTMATSTPTVTSQTVDPGASRRTC